MLVKRDVGAFPHASLLAGSRSSLSARSAVNLKALSTRALVEFPTFSPTKYDVPDDPPKPRSK